MGKGRSLGGSFRIKSPELDERAKAPHTITAACAQKQQQEPIGRSNWTGEIQRTIVTKHMCFTVESGPVCTETQTETLRRQLFIVKRLQYEKSKT